MKNGSKIFFSIVGVLFVVALIAGAGMFGYRAGFAQGVSQAPAVAKALENAAENGQAYPQFQGFPQMMYQRNFGYGYFPMPMHGSYGYSPMMRGGFSHGFNPIGGLLFFLLVVFLVGGFIKMMFFRRAMWNGGHMHGPWGAPSMFDNWHKQAHGEQTEGESKSNE